MTAHDTLCELIKKFEGCKLVAYPDPGTGGDPWTVGYGCTGQDIKQHTVWTFERAEYELEKRASGCLMDAEIASPILKGQTDKIAAIADFIYNCGLSNYKSSTLKKYIDTSQYSYAAKEILRWNHAGKKVMDGLTHRRKAESELLLK